VQLTPDVAARGLDNLHLGFMRHLCVAAFAGFGLAGARRAPTAAALQLRDVVFTVTATDLAAGAPVLGLSVSIVCREEKVPDEHGHRVVFQDSTGDARVAEEAQRNVALLLYAFLWARGAIPACGLEGLRVGDVVPMEPCTEYW
jgi:hypothetical protein